MAGERSTIAEGFSVTHAQILGGTETFAQAIANATPSVAEDIYGVNDASLDPQMDEYDNEGDDAVLSTWSWFKYADVAVQAGYVSFPLIAALTGQDVYSSGTGAGITYAVDLWADDAINVAPFPMIIKMPSKDRDKKIQTLTIGLYSVQFKPITFDGPKYKDGLKINYNGRAVPSLIDEKGVAFVDGKRRTGRLISTA